jgi:acyl-CoA dehydrogenase
MGRAALDEAIRFARESGLDRHERVRDRIEAMTRKVRGARLVCLRACWLVEQRRPNVMDASMAKALGAQVAQQAAGLGLELLGLVAGTGEHLLEKLYRDAKAMDIVEGTGQIQRMIMARQLVGLPR